MRKAMTCSVSAGDLVAQIGDEAGAGQHLHDSGFSEIEHQPLADLPSLRRRNLVVGSQHERHDAVVTRRGALQRTLVARDRQTPPTSAARVSVPNPQMPVFVHGFQHDEGVLQW
jgi:hypothetical protein